MLYKMIQSETSIFSGSIDINNDYKIFFILNLLDNRLFCWVMFIINMATYK